MAVQLASTTRGAAGLGFGFLAAAYALRAVADSADDGSVVHALGWLSPLGWAGRVEAYGANRQWVLLLGLATLVAGVVVGVAILERRDLGAGLIPARTGPARAGPILSGPLGLVTRLARGTILGWTLGLTAGGVVVGSLLGSVADLADDPVVSDFLEQLGGSAGTVEDIFVSTELGFISAAVAAAGVALALRLVGAERSGLGEVVLSTPTSRLRWYAAHVAVPLALTTFSWRCSASSSGWWGPPSPSSRPRSASRSAPRSPSSRRCGCSSRSRLRSRGPFPASRRSRGPCCSSPSSSASSGPRCSCRPGSSTRHRSRTSPSSPAAPSRSVPSLALMALTAVLVVLGGAAYRRRDVA